MKYLLALLILLGWLVTAQASHIDPVKQIIGTTDEGYWVVITTDQHFVSRLCGNANDARIIGCAVWPDNPPILPAKSCLIAVYGDPTNNQEDIDSVYAHEYKHCRIGAFHDDNGADIPGYEMIPPISPSFHPKGRTPQ